MDNAKTRDSETYIDLRAALANVRRDNEEARTNRERTEAREDFVAILRVVKLVLEPQDVERIEREAQAMVEETRE